MATETQEIIDLYMDDFFRGVLSSAKPSIAAKEYIRRRHQMHRFKSLLKLEHLPEELKEQMLNEMVDVLPVFTTKEAYIEAYKKIGEILSKYLEETLEELEELLRLLDPHEVAKAQRVIQRRQKHILESLRENIAEMLLKTPQEELILIDQALSLVINLYERLLEGSKDPELFLFILVLLLRIIGVAKGKFNHDILYEDIAEITGELESDMEVPKEVFELLGV